MLGQSLGKTIDGAGLNAVLTEAVTLFLAPRAGRFVTAVASASMPSSGKAHLSSGVFEWSSLGSVKFLSRLPLVLAKTS